MKPGARRFKIEGNVSAGGGEKKIVGDLSFYLVRNSSICFLKQSYAIIYLKTEINTVIPIEIRHPSVVQQTFNHDLVVSP